MGLAVLDLGDGEANVVLELGAVSGGAVAALALGALEVVVLEDRLVDFLALQVRLQFQAVGPVVAELDESVVDLAGLALAGVGVDLAVGDESLLAALLVGAGEVSFLAERALLDRRVGVVLGAERNLCLFAVIESEGEEVLALLALETGLVDLGAVGVVLGGVAVLAGGAGDVVVLAALAGQRSVVADVVLAELDVVRVGDQVLAFEVGRLGAGHVLDVDVEEGESRCRRWSSRFRWAGGTR